jgi:thioredoxin 1
MRISADRRFPGEADRLAGKERLFMATMALTKDNFEQVVTGNDTVIVDFWAPWCGPCRAFAPTFEATSEKYPGIVFAKVNTEDEPELAGQFDIRSIPTLLVFRDKVMLFSQPGALPASALESIIKKVQELDMAEVHREIAASEAAEAGNPAA